MSESYKTKSLEEILNQVPKKKETIATFSRHHEKGRGPIDDEVMLTEKGEQDAIKQGQIEFLNYIGGKDRLANFLVETGGSSAVRTRNTAELIAAGMGNKNLQGEVVPELNSDLGAMTTTYYGKEAFQAYLEKRLVKWMVEKSDLAKQEAVQAQKEGRTTMTVLEDKKDETGKVELGSDSKPVKVEKTITTDDESRTLAYSEVASNVAKLLLKKIEELRTKKTEQKVPTKIEKTPNLKLSINGVSQTIVECFLHKLIVLTKGKEEATKFLESIGNNGSDFGEGMKCIVSKDPKTGETKLLVTYVKNYTKTEVVTNASGQQIEKKTPAKFSYFEYVTPGMLGTIRNDPKGNIGKEGMQKLIEIPADFKLNENVEEIVREDLRKLYSHEQEYKTADATINYFASGLHSTLDNLFTEKVLNQTKILLKIWHPQEQENIDSINSFKDFDGLSQGDRWWFKQQAGKAVRQYLDLDQK